MKTIDTLVVGAGHAGLATSRLLTDAGRDHLVLERGRLADRWWTERWDSLRLLTPNWMTRLPSWRPAGSQADGHVTAREFAEHLGLYARSFAAPVQEHTTVLDVRAADAGYQVTTSWGTWQARHLVVATGPGGRPAVPDAAAGLSPDVPMVTSSRYRNPAALPAGGVLVVGASASGVQIADELAGSGRRVVLAVGQHSRVPRRYRGMDVFWWLLRTGKLDRTVDEVGGVPRREPSLQLVGRTPPRDVGLVALQHRGVELVGRWVATDGVRLAFAPDLPVSAARADARQARLLDEIDRHIAASGLEADVLPPDRPAGFAPPPGRGHLDLRAEGISTVLLATGQRVHVPWLRVPVLAADGSVRQRRGVTAAPGLYVVGQPFQHRRSSGLIEGARHDVRAVVAHLLDSSSGVPLEGEAVA